MAEKEIDALWKSRYKTIAMSTDVDYSAYMFGNDEMGIPWCAGYAVGYMIVHKYLALTGKRVSEILEVKPESMLV